MSTKKTNDTPQIPQTPEQLLMEARQAREEALRLLEQVRLASGQADDPAAARILEEDRISGEEPVDILLFKDNGHYKDDVFVAVNGETVAIKRGEKVTVKRKFAQVLENSRLQDDRAARLMEQKARLFRESGL